VSKFIGISITNDQIRFASKDWLYQPRDIRGAILIVRIGVDDNVRAEQDAGVKSGRKRAGEPAVARHSSDMVNTCIARNGTGAVSAAIVNHEHFDAIYALYAARQVSNRRREVLTFVITRDLND
jgi:hypothetical protein